LAPNDLSTSIQCGTVGTHRTLVAAEGVGCLRLDGDCWHEMI
jgi:hypothetical protein